MHDCYMRCKALRRILRFLIGNQGMGASGFLRSLQTIRVFEKEIFLTSLRASLPADIERIVGRFVACRSSATLRHDVLV